MSKEQDTAKDELATHSKRVQARKPDNRIKYARRLGILWLPAVLSISGLAISIAWNFPEVSVWSALLFVPSILIAIFSGMAWVPRLVYPLDPLDSAFEKVYKALPYVTQDAKDQPETRLVRRLLTGAVRDLGTDSAREQLAKEASDLLSSSLENLETFLVTAAREGTLKPEALKVLAGVLSSPSMDGLRKLNSHLETNYTADTEHDISLRESYENFRKTRQGRILESLAFGFGIVLFFSYFYTVATQQVFSVFAKEHPEVVLLGSFTLSGISYFRK